ncbi:hypothetical protein ACIBF6_41320 [Streptosporangium amethystogenes]|uniref:hypothetical protein n=1 Tax=Streptosporangium amethystogenes TaxID=2002 RepID=UPI0037913F15
MTVRVESNAQLTPEQERIYRLRHTLERDGGTPGGFLELLASVVTDGTWRQVPSGVNTDEPFTSFKDFIEAKPPFGLGHRAADIRTLLQIRHPHEGAKSVRQEMDAMRAEVVRLLAEDGITGYTEEQRNRDIKAWSALDKAGGWWLGFFVACQVYVGKAHGSGRKSDQRRNPGVEGASKISARDFAQLAGTSVERVMRYYRAWEAARESGVVTKSAEELYPGHEPIDLPVAEDWGLYYSSRKGASTERGVLISAAAEAEGIRPTKALEVSENPTALRAAILADARTAEAARTALLDRMQDDSALQAAMVKTLISDSGLKKAVAAEAKRSDQIGYVRKVVEEGKIKTPAGQFIEAPDNVRIEAERRLALVEQRDDATAAQSAAEAYEALQQLIVEAIEADPTIKIHERRAKFYGRVQKATKAFADLDLDDATDMYEEDMVESLERLMGAIAKCLENVKKAASRQSDRPD